MKRNKNSLIATLFSYNEMIWALFICLAVIAAVLLADIKEKQTSDKTSEEPPAGSISVYVYWKDGIDLDLDTHVKSPDEDERVFYGRLAGKTWNLLRDDLGKINDPTTDRNFENAYARGLPPGDYIVNVHAYRGATALYPAEVEVEVVITANPNAGKGGQKIVKQKITLYATGEEATVVRFKIDADGNVVPNSINHVFKSLIKKDRL